MLTAKTSVLDLMQGISVGADDYIKKPFNPLEVTLRVKSLLRRYRDYEADRTEAAFEVDNTVMVHITKIREKLEDTPRKPTIIKTVWGVGYRL